LSILSLNCVLDNISALLILSIFSLGIKFFIYSFLISTLENKLKENGTEIKTLEDLFGINILN